MGWNKSIPLSSTNAATTPSFYQGNWDALEGFFGVEHNTYTSVNSGKHVIGETGVMMEGVTSAITAVSTTPGSGAIAFDTTVGAWVYNGQGDDEQWKTIHRWLPTTRVLAYVATDYNPTSGGSTVVTFGTEGTDSLGEFSTSTYVFSAKEAGYFFVHANLLIKTSTEAGGDALTLSLSGSAGVYMTRATTTPSTAYFNLGLTTVAEVASGGTLTCLIAAPSNATTTISGGAGCSYLRIHRMS